MKTSLLCLSLLLAASASLARAADQTLIVAGDVAQCNALPATESAAARTARLAARLLGQGGTIIIPGDTTYPVGAPAEFRECWQPTWGALNARVIPAPGNHEYGTEAAAGYFDYFGTTAGPARRGYYSVELGAWHIVSLNSQIKGAEAAQQLDWLRTDLAAARGRHTCLLAVWHHPVFSSGLHGSSTKMREVLEILQAAGADLILTGHDHHYERFGRLTADGKPDAHAPREFIVGTGGAGLYALSPLHPGSEAAISGQHGVLKLDLGAKGYRWGFYGLDGAAPLDAGEDSCLPKP